jgi:hypothetical protein
MTPIHHRARGIPESLCFTGEGVRYEHPFVGALELGWSNITSVSLVPALERTDAGWSTKFAPSLEVVTRWERERCVEVSLVLKDRRPVIARAGGWWRRLCARSVLRPLHDADWNPLPDEGFLRFDIWERHLDVPLDVFLDVLASKAKLGMLVGF